MSGDGCEGKGGPLLERAIARSLRAGGSSSVVDPLLSLLVDLHRLQDQVVDTLCLLGVDVTALPPRYRRVDSPSSPVQTPHAPPSDATADHTRPAAADPPIQGPSKTSQVAAPSFNALAAYCARAASLDPRRHASACDVTAPCSLTAQLNVAEGVLCWLEDKVQHPPTGVSAPTSQQRDAARHLLASWVTCLMSGTGTPALAEDNNSPRDPVVDEGVGTSANAHRKRHRHEPAVWKMAASDGELKAPAPVPPGKQSAGVSPLGTYSSAELAQMVDMWSHYKRGLSIASRQAGTLLHALCAPELGASLSTHAKWNEVTAADRKQPFRLPSCASLTANYEGILSVHDCFASCQQPVHDALVALETHIDTLCDEALVVSERDRQFWDHMRCFQSEYAALHEMKSHVGHIIGAVQSIIDEDQ